MNSFCTTLLTCIGSNISCWAEVQTAQACLIQSEINMPVVYKQVPVMSTARILNQTLLPTVFEWGQVGAICRILHELALNINFHITCKFEDVSC